MTSDEAKLRLVEDALSQLESDKAREIHERKLTVRIERTLSHWARTARAHVRYIVARFRYRAWSLPRRWIGHTLIELGCKLTGIDARDL